MRRRAGLGISVLLCLVAFLAVSLGHRAVIGESRAGGVGGSVTVIDGDTIQVADKVIQLYGIDAPELGQRCSHDGIWIKCGLNAAYELNKQLGMSYHEVKCYASDAVDDSSKICLVGDVDIAQTLLMAGFVTAHPNANPDYRELEDKARDARLGLWHSEFVDPSEWRLGRRLPGEPDFGPEDCPIKAVRLADGHGVYYVPTDEGYDSIAVDFSRGDRLYCSDERARSDGWRRQHEAAGP